MLAGSTSWTEISAAERLQELRDAERGSRGASFSTISASGPNAAVIHYSPTEATNRAISREDVYLGTFLAFFFCCRGL